MDLLGAWSFSCKFLLNSFVWFGLNGCTSQVVVDDYLYGGDIFIVCCRILILIILSLSSYFKFNALMFCFMLGFVITVVVFSLSYELVCYKSELNYNNFDLVALPAPTDGTNSTSNTLKVKRRICK